MSPGYSAMAVKSKKSVPDFNTGRPPANNTTLSKTDLAAFSEALPSVSVG